MIMYAWGSQCLFCLEISVHQGILGYHFIAQILCVFSYYLVSFCPMDFQAWLFAWIPEFLEVRSCLLFKNHSLLIFDSNNFLTSSSTSTFFLLLGDALWRCFPFFKFDILKFYFLYFYLIHSFFCSFLPFLPPLSLFRYFFQNFCFIAETVFHVELFLSTLLSFSLFF